MYSIQVTARREGKFFLGDPKDSFITRFMTHGMLAYEQSARTSIEMGEALQ